MMAAQLLALACCMLGLACKYRLYFTTYPTSSSSFGFSHQESPQRIFLLQLFLSSVSSSVTSTSAMSSFTTSITSFLAFPRLIFPVTSIINILLPIYLSYFLHTCPNHISLVSRVFYPNRPTRSVPLMYSFLILSNDINISYLF